MLGATFETGHLPATFLNGIIVLIYKNGTRDTLDKYRPITLLNTDYKAQGPSIQNVASSASLR